MECLFCLLGFCEISTFILGKRDSLATCPTSLSTPCMHIGMYHETRDLLTNRMNSIQCREGKMLKYGVHEAKCKGHLSYRNILTSMVL